MNSVSIIVPTFGNFDTWDAVAETAVKSAYAQTVKAEIIRVHEQTLAKARNRGAEQARGKWLIFLDADDELNEEYVEAMLAGDGNIRQPSTVDFTGGFAHGVPNLIPQTDLLTRNYLVIGSMVTSDLFDKAGGFEEYPILEDWSFFLSCIANGGKVGQVPKAVYRIHFNEHSRNTDLGLHGKIAAEIRQKYVGKV